MTTSRASRTRSHRPQRGVAMVEFCLGAPILLLLFCSIVEIGEMLSQASALADAARGAARYVSTNALRGSTGVVNLSGQVIRTAQNVAVYGNAAGFGRPVIRNLARNDVSVMTDGTGNVSISIACPYESLFGGVIPLFFTGGSIVTGGLTLTAYTSMRAQ